MIYQPIIGLEIHVQLKTKSKMFCACKNEFDLSNPNINVCPICLAHPGTLPTINQKAVEQTIMAGLALNCQINQYSKFDRKNYFYPDLPKGYQISQYDQPLAINGELEIGDKKIKITRIHLEEDTGKLIHVASDNSTLVDFNRASAPLMELVTEPDIRSSAEAKTFCQELQLILRGLDISDANMEKGQMRCEVNISLLEEKKYQKLKDYSTLKKLTTKVEVKNINSFKAVEKAIEYEIKRQTEILDKKEKIISETRGWNDKKLITESQRIKEEAHDYRYFPEPDLPPMIFTPEKIQELKTKIPELPMKKRQRFINEYFFSTDDAYLFSQNKDLAKFIEQVISEAQMWLHDLEQPREEDTWEKNKKKIIKLITSWLSSELFKLMNERKLTINEQKITPENFAEFITLLYSGKINGTAGQSILRQMFDTGAEPTHIMKEQDLGQVDNTAELEPIVEEIIAKFPKQVEEYKNGKEPVFQFLLGQCMAKTRGRANPGLIRELLKKKLI